MLEVNSGAKFKVSKLDPDLPIVGCSTGARWILQVQLPRCLKIKYFGFFLKTLLWNILPANQILVTNILFFFQTLLWKLLSAA